MFVSPLGDGPWDGIVLCILRLLRFGQIFAGVLRRLARLKLASPHQEMVRDDVCFPGISAPQALSSILHPTRHWDDEKLYSKSFPDGPLKNCS